VFYDYGQSEFVIIMIVIVNITVDSTKLSTSLYLTSLLSSSILDRFSVPELHITLRNRQYAMMHILFGSTESNSSISRWILIAKPSRVIKMILQQWFDALNF